MVTIELPSALQPYARGSATLVLDERCATVGDALAVVAARWPGVRDRMMDEQGALRPHVNVFVDEHNIRFIGGLEAPLDERSTITVVPAVSGG